MSLYICLSLQNVQHQEQTVMQTVDHGWLWCVSVGSSLLKNVPSSSGVDNVGDCVVWGKEQSLYILNFVVNLKLMLRNIILFVE